MSRKPTLCTQSAAAPMTAAVRAAVDYILRQARPVEWIEIIDIFVEDEDCRRETRSMREGLRQAVRLGMLVSDGRGIDRVWARPGHVFADPATAQDPARASAWCGPIAAPRQVDVMYGPVYVPRPAPVLRPGALDFKACASRGFRC